MIITRATLESEDGFLQTKLVAAAPESYGEFLYMCFRSGYVISNQFSRDDSWYPVFEKQVAIKASGETCNRSFTLRPIRQEGYSVE